MLDEYFIVNRKVLPDVFEKVIEVKRMMESGTYKKVSDACKHVDLSRSAYYKYKDYIFEAGSNEKERKAVISFILSHEKGRLSEVLNILTSLHCSILTMTQNIPVHNKASVTVSIDISDMTVSPNELLQRIGENNGVSKLELISLE